jgi:hypothetical protein
MDMGKDTARGRMILSTRISTRYKRSGVWKVTTLVVEIGGS